MIWFVTLIRYWDVCRFHVWSLPWTDLRLHSKRNWLILGMECKWWLMMQHHSLQIVYSSNPCATYECVCLCVSLCGDKWRIGLSVQSGSYQQIQNTFIHSFNKHHKFTIIPVNHHLSYIILYVVHLKSADILQWHSQRLSLALLALQ